jgi:transposase
MAAERLSMHQTLGLSHRAVARSLGIGVGTIKSALTRARGAGLDWPQVQPPSEPALEGRLYGRSDVAASGQRRP